MVGADRTVSSQPPQTDEEWRDYWHLHRRVEKLEEETKAASKVTAPVLAFFKYWPIWVVITGGSIGLINWNAIAAIASALGEIK